MDSSYQIRETHYGDLSLTVHDRINDLHDRADGLARAVADSAMDSGCTDKTRREHSGMGPRQQKAWDMIAEAHSWCPVPVDPRCGLPCGLLCLESDGRAGSLACHLI